MTLSEEFRKSRENIVASYSYTDIAEGTGVNQYKGAATQDSSAAKKFLTTQDIFSTLIETSAISGAATAAKIIDLDFDLPAYNLPITIRGTALINSMMTIIYSGAGSAGDVINSYLIIKIRKWDGTTETEIASAQSQTLSDNVGTGKSEMVALTITIPKTHFKKGETFRMTIEGWGWATGGATVKDCRLTIGHDPKNRDGTYIIPSTDVPQTTTKLNAFIPYDLTL